MIARCKFSRAHARSCVILCQSSIEPGCRKWLSVSMHFLRRTCLYVSVRIVLKMDLGGGFLLRAPTLLTAPTIRRRVMDGMSVLDWGKVLNEVGRLSRNGSGKDILKIEGMN